jgi:hypothetical protein
MHLLTKVILTALTVVFANSSAPSLTLPRGVGHKEQLGDQAGPYIINNGPNRSGRLADSRDFLWEHWRERRYGHLAVTWISKEGRAANTTYTVEKNAQGVWSISVKTQWTPGKGDGPVHAPVEYRVYLIRRAETEGDSQSGTIFLQDNEKRSAATYRLVFFDMKGSEMGGM